MPVPVLSVPRPFGPHGVCLALGMFDGVHLGHQHVIRQSRIDARTRGATTVVATFDPHPLTVVRPDKAPRLLQSLPQRIATLESQGTDAVLVLRFDEALSRKSGEAFVRELVDGFGGLRSFTVGQGFHFGQGRSGNVPLLRSLGRELGFSVNAVAPIHIGTEVVSSTRVRGALRDGKLGLVAELLGRPYSIVGPVVRGDQLGQSFGIPTANLDVEGFKAFVRDHLSDNLGDGASQMLSSLKLGGSVLLALLGHAILVPVALYYFLLAWPDLWRRCRRALPVTWHRRLDPFMAECDQVLGGYVRGQLSVMLAMALYYSLALQIGGLDLAWPIGIFTGLALCVPYVGFGMGLLLALLSACLQFTPLHALLLVAVVYAMGQLIEGFFLTPRWVGERIGLHPLMVIFALLAFGQLLGFVGVLLALPASAVLLVAWRHWVGRWLQESGKT